MEQRGSKEIDGNEGRGLRTYIVGVRSTEKRRSQAAWEWGRGLPRAGREHESKLQRSDGGGRPAGLTGRRWHERDETKDPRRRGRVPDFPRLNYHFHFISFLLLLLLMAAFNNLEGVNARSVLSE